MEQEVLRALTRMASALERIAEAIRANAEATVMLARATAGDMDDGDEPQAGSLSEVG